PALFHSFFILPRPPPTSPLFPYTTLFRSQPDDARHVFAESSRNIRSSIFFMPYEGPRPKSFLVTSTVTGEGTSTVSANLAITMISEEHTSELQSRFDLVCRLLLEKKIKQT